MTDDKPRARPKQDGPREWRGDAPRAGKSPCDNQDCESDQLGKEHVCLKAGEVSLLCPPCYAQLVARIRSHPTYTNR